AVLLPRTGRAPPQRFFNLQLAGSLTTRLRCSDLRGLQTRRIPVMCSPDFRAGLENQNYEATMKKIDQDELYENLRGFLKSKGIALDSGAYAQRIHQGCNLLADAINATRSKEHTSELQSREN